MPGVLEKFLATRQREWAWEWVTSLAEQAKCLLKGGFAIVAVLRAMRLVRGQTTKTNQPESGAMRRQHGNWQIRFAIFAPAPEDSRKKCQNGWAAGLSKQFRMKCNRESGELICNFMAAAICTSSSSLCTARYFAPGDDLSIVQSGGAARRGTCRLQPANG